MNVTDLIAELSNKIDEYLDTAVETIQDHVSTYNTPGFNYADIPDSVWESLTIQIKQATIIFTVYHNTEEIQSDTFPQNYSICNLSSNDLDDLSTFKIIPNNNNPIFLIRELFDINDFNKQTMLYFAKSLLDNWENIDYSAHDVTVFIPNCTDPIDTIMLIPFLKLIIIADGEKFHNHITPNRRNFLAPLLRNSISCPAKNYDQYNESIYILSEYNNSNDLLQKYLLLYTVIENFMYRKPIADLLRRHTGFTLRNFKELYKKVEKSEEDVLKKLFLEVKGNLVFPGQTIEQYVEQTYITFTTANPQYQSNLFDDMPFITTNIKSDFPSLIYRFRNSIVHNKETEFHLTHLKLDNIQEAQNCLQDFLLPVLENIIYSLLLDTSSPLDYVDPHIQLYRSN